MLMSRSRKLRFSAQQIRTILLWLLLGMIIHIIVLLLTMSGGELFGA